MESGAGQTNLNDESVTAEAGSHQTIVNTIINDQTAKWLVIVFLAFGMAYAVTKGENADYHAGFAQSAAERAQRTANLAQYYTIDQEVYLYKQGLTPPRDPWALKQKGNPK